MEETRKTDQIFTEIGEGNYPSHIKGTTQYEVVMGSAAYGVSNLSSDRDIYCWCIPPKEMIFPHLAGYITGFGTMPPSFSQYQQHHVICGGCEYDLVVYNIVRYFSLLLENNPNMIDSISVPSSCILFETPLGEKVRLNRSLFLHKGLYNKFYGYAVSQFGKLKTANRKNPTRMKSITDFGYDVKFAYHMVRLLDECKQLLETGELDLQLSREKLSEIRAGSWTIRQIEQYFFDMKRTLEVSYKKTSLPSKPREDEVKELLHQVLEEYYV